jgi:sugar phosphate isomerase/epimerase
MTVLPIALQLYTVRDHMERDPGGTLRRVRMMGYENVELAGLAGCSAAEMKALLDESGLSSVSAHFGYEEFTADLDGVIEKLRDLGLQYAVVPWLGGEACPDRGAWIRAAQRMDSAGARLRESGIQLCYHNHAHEFEKLDGEYIFDIIFENSDPENLAVQLDTCWASAGGMDVPALLKKYSGRVPLLHIKDYKPGNPPVLTEAGSGCMDWDAVLPAGRAAGARWCIVEQDDWEQDSLESARQSLEFLKTKSW